MYRADEPTRQDEIVLWEGRGVGWIALHFGSLSKALLFWRFARLSRRQRQLGRAIQHVAFLRRELSLVSVGVNLALPRLWRHRPQGLNGVPHCLAALWRKLLHLIVDLPGLLFLLRSQVLPGFHPVQHLLLFFRRHVVEALQLVAQLLLPLRRKVAELRIAFKRFSLLLRGKVPVLA